VGRLFREEELSQPLAGRAGIITGAASGIGRHIAGAFASAGARVALFDRDEEGVQAAAKSLAGDGLGMAVDITDEKRVEQAVLEAEEGLGRLDFLVNNAGVRHQASIVDHDIETWRRTVDVNLTGTFICSRATLRVMLGQGSGKILNIASIAGVLAMSNRVAYAASKAGIIGLTRAMAVELGPQGIHCNAIAPGVIETPLTASYFEDEAFASLIVENTPLRRWGQPNELAPAAIFLCGGDSDFVQGVTLCVDGGWVAGKGY
jgi:NAD(P)-dependent dehydrogenase (short-subunit alcohol dehydrogenase family)